MEIGKINNFNDFEFNSKGQYRYLEGQWLSGSITNKSKKRYCTLKNETEKKKYAMDILVYSALRNKGEIVDEVYHIDGNVENNNISNLQKEKIEIKHEHRDKSEVIRAENTETGEILYFKNSNQVSKYFKCSCANIHYILFKNNGNLFGCIKISIVKKTDDMKIEKGPERKTKHKTEEERKNAIRESIKRSIEKRKKRQCQQTEQ